MRTVFRELVFKMKPKLLLLVDQNFQNPAYIFNWSLFVALLAAIFQSLWFLCSSQSLTLLLLWFLRPECFLPSSSHICLLFIHQISVYVDPSIQRSFHLYPHCKALPLQHHTKIPPQQHCWRLTRRSKAEESRFASQHPCQERIVSGSHSVKCQRKIDISI